MFPCNILYCATAGFILYHLLFPCRVLLVKQCCSGKEYILSYEPINNVITDYQGRMDLLTVKAKETNSLSRQKGRLTLKQMGLTHYLGEWY